VVPRRNLPASLQSWKPPNSPWKAQASAQEPTTVIGQLVIESPQTRSLSVWSGELADRFGARRTYVLATLMAAVSGLLMFPVTNYWLLLPVLLFLAGAAAAFGVSVLRTLPQGSEEALASGIFLRDSL